MPLKRIGVAVAMAALAMAQTKPVARPEFEVASIKPDPRLDVSIGRPPGGRLVARGVTAKLLIGLAYSVKTFHILDGPS